MAEPRCADISADREEPAWATASMVRGWVLIEQPGAWGREAVSESRLPASVGEKLMDGGRPHRVRTILLRQPDRPRAGPRHCFVSYSGRPEPWIEHRLVDDSEDLLDLDVAAMAGSERPRFGDPWPLPLYLVCTNGRHDPCCARLGRPVIRELLPERPEQVWECSHIGGDRFAGNLVCLPHGLYFGRLGPDEAAEVIERYEQGTIHLDYYRGRAGDPFPVQAAEYFLRREIGLAGIDDVTPLDRRRSAGRDGVVVTAGFRTVAGKEFEVAVGIGTGDPRLLTCTAPSEARPPAYRLLGVITRERSGPAVH